MGNCIVTKLKGVVDNDNLVKIGEGIIEVIDRPAPFQMTIGGTDGTLTMMDGATVNVGGSEVTTVAFGDITGTFPAGTYRIKISGKYGLNAFADYYRYGVSNFKIPVDMIAYSPDMVTLGFVYVDGDIKALKDLKKLQTFSVYDISGVVSDLAALLNNNANLNGFQIYSQNFAGNLADLAAVTKNIAVNIKNTNINGDIRDLVAAWRSAGITEKDMDFVLYNNIHITFGEYTNFGESNRAQRLKWTASSIYWQDGTDTQVADSSQNIAIYAQGVSQAQISTWESQGNTVYVVA